jgi:hypothetical protein
MALTPASSLPRGTGWSRRLSSCSSSGRRWRSASRLSCRLQCHRQWTACRRGGARQGRPVGARHGGALAGLTSGGHRVEPAIEVLAVSGAEMRAEAEADRKRCYSVGQSWAFGI